MNKKFLPALIIISLVLNFLFACQNTKNEIDNKFENPKINENEINTIEDAPYYHITNAYTKNEKNMFMDLNVTIPKIVCSKEGNNELLEKVNKELFETVKGLIENSKDKAKETFKLYIETAKTNIMADKKAKVESLLDKYKSVLIDEDYEIVDEIFFKNNRVTTKSEISPFTDTEDLIIDGLHNKKIIIVETTEAETEKRIRSSNSNIVKPERSIKYNKNNGNNENLPRNESTMPKNKSEIPRSSKSEVERKNFQRNDFQNNDFQKNHFQKNNFKNNFLSKKRKATISEPKKVIKDITIENFYYELDEIRKIKVPDNRYLIMSYTPTKINCTYDIKCLDNQYISLFIQIEETKTTNSYKRLYYNIDITNQKLLKLRDLLGENFKEMCIEKINNDISKWNNDKKADLKENYDVSKYIDNDTTFFINNNHKVVVELEKYAITLGGAGYQEFQIN